MTNQKSTSKNFFWNAFSLIRSAFRMFTSPKKILAALVEQEMRLERYRRTDLETLKRSRQVLLRQVADPFAPGEKPELQLADIKAVIEEKEELIRTEQEKQRLLAEQKFVQRTREVREHLGSGDSLPISS